MPVGFKAGAVQTVANKAKPVAAELMQNQVLPRMKQGESVDSMAKVASACFLMYVRQPLC